VAAIASWGRLSRCLACADWGKGTIRCSLSPTLPADSGRPASAWRQRPLSSVQAAIAVSISCHVGSRANFLYRLSIAVNMAILTTLAARDC
jgi:hypothetical protein